MMAALVIRSRGEMGRSVVAAGTKRWWARMEVIFRHDGRGPTLSSAQSEVGAGR